MPEFEIIADGGWRRRWSASEKLRIVEEPLDSRNSISVVACRHGAAPNLLISLASADIGGRERGGADGDNGTSNKTARQMGDRIRELERQLGKRTLEVDILKEEWDRPRSKNRYCLYACYRRTVVNRA